MLEYSVMKKNDNSSSFEKKEEKQYITATDKGFQGTKEEYLELRDHI